MKRKNENQHRARVTQSHAADTLESHANLKVWKQAFVDELSHDADALDVNI